MSLADEPKVAFAAAAAETCLPPMLCAAEAWEVGSAGSPTDGGT